LHPRPKDFKLFFTVKPKCLHPFLAEQPMSKTEWTVSKTEQTMSKAERTVSKTAWSYSKTALYVLFKQ